MKSAGLHETRSFVSVLGAERHVCKPDRQSEAKCWGSRLGLGLGWGLPQALLATLDPGLGETGRLETEATSLSRLSSLSR